MRHTELKPPAEVVEAIMASEDGSTAPPSADISSGPGGFSGNTPRTIRNALEHEEPQRPSELAAKEEAEGGVEGLAAAQGNRAMKAVCARACLNPPPRHASHMGRLACGAPATDAHAHGVEAHGMWCGCTPLSTTHTLSSNA